jgi:hypothetical protein
MTANRPRRRFIGVGGAMPGGGLLATADGGPAFARPDP